MTVKRKTMPLGGPKILGNALVPNPNAASDFMQKKQDSKFIASHPIKKMSNGVGWGGEPPKNFKYGMRK